MREAPALPLSPPSRNFFNFITVKIPVLYMYLVPGICDGVLWGVTIFLYVSMYTGIPVYVYCSTYGDLSQCTASILVLPVYILR